MGERAIRCALQLSQSLIRRKRQRREEAKPALDAAIGLHIGLMTAGVLESGQHYEFTVVGDAVNVAQRFERLAKKLDAVLVVSAAILERRLPRCLIPGFDSAPLSSDLRDALWDRFFTAAPQRQRRSVERYSIVKRA
jgi:class 3 adenylate cyclase